LARGAVRYKTTPDATATPPTTKPSVERARVILLLDRCASTEPGAAVHVCALPPHGARRCRLSCERHAPKEAADAERRGPTPPDKKAEPALRAAGVTRRHFDRLITADARLRCLRELRVHGGRRAELRDDCCDHLRFGSVASDDVPARFERERARLS